MIISVSIIEELKNHHVDWIKMRLIICSESQCLDRIFSDYSKNVSSRKEYDIWANHKYQTLIKFSKNPENSQIVASAMNFVTCLYSVSVADNRLKSEIIKEGKSEVNTDILKIRLLREFDPVGQERGKIATELKEAKSVGG